MALLDLTILPFISANLSSTTIKQEEAAAGI